MVTVLLIEATPGPNMAYLAALTLGEGRRAGYRAVAGVAFGLGLVGLAAAVGLAEVLTRSPLAWTLLRWAGIGYLLWLAWEGWHGIGGTAPGDARPARARHFVRGLTTNLLNPKAALFYVVMLPEFVSPATPALPQTLMLTALSVAVASFIHLTIVTLAGRAHQFLTGPSRARATRRGLAVALVIVAMWFAASTNRPLSPTAPPPPARVS
ncbi:LysE family translocator [Sphingomonas sp. 28-63-12]|uniref:LysE family translocator n=1 Tax=Sphingomonas sp. 28-63-12 TaxID=1970434 RepID=UPI000BD16E30|nr:MAG: lysine transporter LysE [Sphingomonas sp. 28-63-12]